MRPVVLALALLVTRLAVAQQPIAPAAPPVEQADDAEVPPPLQRPASASPPAPPPTSAPPVVTRAPVTLTLPPGWRYQVVDAPPTAKRNDALIIAGSLMLSVGYLANLQAGIPTGQLFLDVPLIGPLIEIANMPTGQPLFGWIDFVLVGDALVQMTGLAFTIAGATTWQHKPGVQRLELVPTLAGAALRGTF